ncbi:GIY-YIG nuclease family protein [Streptomyces sp. NPDC001833]|uniref:GIY-YIG nuclease family protein n=1 Tax=Streptomyces sp. NPDC001833 TaxID=3154658 RepID=UPI003321E712
MSGSLRHRSKKTSLRHIVDALIGMARRRESMDRVRKLGDASVPFRYDVHALHCSEDAVTLESELHEAFTDRRVNFVNERREFFFATPSEVRALLAERVGGLLEFTEEPAALEYFQSRSRRPQQSRTWIPLEVSGTAPAAVRAAPAGSTRELVCHSSDPVQLGRRAEVDDLPSASAADFGHPWSRPRTLTASVNPDPSSGRRRARPRTPRFTRTHHPQQERLAMAEPDPAQRHPAPSPVTRMPGFAHMYSKGADHDSDTKQVRVPSLTPRDRPVTCGNAGHGPVCRLATAEPRPIHPGFESPGKER